MVCTRPLRGIILHIVTSVSISRLIVSVLKSKLVKKFFGSGTQKESRKFKKYIMKSVINCVVQQNLIRVTKGRSLRCARKIALMGETGNMKREVTHRLKERVLWQT